MIKHDIKKIRLAICSNEGGFDNQPDDMILKVWSILPPETQEKYMDAIKSKSTKEVTNADRNESKLDVQARAGERPG